MTDEPGLWPSCFCNVCMATLASMASWVARDLRSICAFTAKGLPPRSIPAFREAAASALRIFPMGWPGTRPGNTYALRRGGCWMAAGNSSLTYKVRSKWSALVIHPSRERISTAPVFRSMQSQVRLNASACKFNLYKIGSILGLIN